MTRIAVYVFVIGAAATIAFHLAMIAGAPWGHLTLGGRWVGVLPPAVRALSALSALSLGAMAYLALSAAGLTRWTPPIWLDRALLAYMALAILMHIATPSEAERALWLPVIAVMTLALAVVVFARDPVRPDRNLVDRARDTDQDG